MEMEQPCAALRGCLCDIYEDRPGACARYACLLRKRVEQGVVSLSEARTEVHEARTLEARIRTALQLPSERSLWQGIANLERPATPELEAAWASAHAPTLAAVSSLITILRNAFEPRFAGAGTRICGPR